ncbi:hypothetical protein E2986_13757, partial [Frieseomelitta varia]
GNAIDEESPSSITGSLTVAASSSGDISLDASENIDQPLPSSTATDPTTQRFEPKANERHSQSPNILNESTKPPVQRFKSTPIDTPTLLLKKSSPDKSFELRRFSDIENKVTIKLPSGETLKDPRNPEESVRVPSSPEDTSDREIVEVRKDSALFLEEAQGLPALRENLKSRGAGIVSPRRGSSGYESNLGTFDEDRRNSSSVDVLQDPSFLKERRRSSASLKRLNSRVVLGRAEESLTEDVEIERMPTTEVHWEVSGAGLEMPNIEEVKEVFRDDTSIKQVKRDLHFPPKNTSETTIETTIEHQDTSSGLFESSLGDSTNRLSFSPASRSSTQLASRLPTPTFLESSSRNPDRLGGKSCDVAATMDSTGSRNVSPNTSSLKNSASSDIQTPASDKTADDSNVREAISSGEAGTSQGSHNASQNVSVRPIYPYCPCSPYGSPQGSPRNRRKPLRESRRVSIDNKEGALQLNQYKLLDNIGQVYREIALLKKLDHPNVVKLVEVLDDPDEDNLYLVFELVQRGEILQVPTDKPLDEETARKNFRDIVMGVEYLHYQRIVHRDIKPSNLLVDSDGRIKIADLGVSTELRACGELLSGPTGTPAFAAPETTMPGVHYSGTLCDIWSMGVTLYCLVTGRIPWDGTGSIIGVQAAIRNEPLKFPEKPVISKDLRDLISRMLNKNSLERITLSEIKEHIWLTNCGAEPLPSEADNCQLPVTVTDEEVERVVTKIPKLVTLILIKTMLRQHSFQNPFLPKESEKTTGTEETSPERKTTKNPMWERFSKTGRSKSAPGFYNWQTNRRQLSINSPLSPVMEAPNQETEVEERHEKSRN